MIQPKLYYRNNALQKRDAQHVLDEYLHLVNFERRGGTVLDVGCGVGDVTCELLAPRLPDTVGAVVGVDVSDEMVRFAASKWADHRNVVFGRMNVADEGVPVDYEEGFDHVFSFYCLHWIVQQR